MTRDYNELPIKCSSNKGFHGDLSIQPATNLVRFDSDEACNLLLLLHSTVDKMP